MTAHALENYGRASTAHRPVNDLRDLQIGTYRRAHAPQFPPVLKEREKVTKIPIAHLASRCKPALMTEDDMSHRKTDSGIWSNIPLKSMGTSR